MIAVSRLSWLARRLSRIYPAEVPFRIHGVLRSLWQSRGIGDARSVPAPASDARMGTTWVARAGAPDGIDRAALLSAADALVEGRLEVFGAAVPFFDGAPDWNRDPVGGAAIALKFGLFIDFRHIPGLDIKHLWEVNRHCWWVPVAQAWALTQDDRYLQALQRWLRSWLDACPYPMGANWASPVEHGIRLINWSLVWHLLGGERSPLFAGTDGAALKARWLECIYRHMRFAHDNYSFYSSADNHLIGEAAGVFVASQTWDLWSEGRQLGARAKAILEQEALKQFAPDGVNREQAFCYHKFSLEFLLASALAARANGADFSAAFWQRVEAAIVCLASLMDVRGQVPPIGDADDAAVFELAHGPRADPYQALVLTGARLFNRPELQRKVDALAQTMAAPPLPDAMLWLLGEGGGRPIAPPAMALPRRFDAGGYMVFGDRLDQADEIRIVFDCGPLGYNRIGGHAHADALQLQLSWGGTPMLVDSGTYCYNAAPQWRRHFRGTAAHNTLEVDGTEQSLYGGSFLWLKDLASTVESFDDDGRRVALQASHDGYRRLKSPATHRRHVSFDRVSRTLTIGDELTGTGSHEAALHWHLAPGCRVQARGDGFEIEHEGRRLMLQISGHGIAVDVVQGQEDPPLGWISRRFYAKEPAPVVRARASLAAGARLVTTIRLLTEEAVA